MSTNVPCSSGTEITSESRCRAAHNEAASLGLDPKRSLVVGSWNGVPYQCSAQVQGDDSLHFNSRSDSDHSKFTKGEYVMICELKTTTTPPPPPCQCTNITSLDENIKSDIPADGSSPLVENTNVT